MNSNIFPACLDRSGFYMCLIIANCIMIGIFPSFFTETLFPDHPRTVFCLTPLCPCLLSSAFHTPSVTFCTPSTLFCTYPTPTGGVDEWREGSDIKHFRFIRRTSVVLKYEYYSKTIVPVLKNKYYYNTDDDGTCVYLQLF